MARFQIIFENDGRKLDERFCDCDEAELTTAVSDFISEMFAFSALRDGDVIRIVEIMENDK